jgi:hypothetical protein
MIRKAYAALLLALYQFSILVGILLFPVALALGRAGVALPMDRVIDHLGTAYENAA